MAPVYKLVPGDDPFSPENQAKMRAMQRARAESETEAPRARPKDEGTSPGLAIIGPDGKRWKIPGWLAEKIFYAIIGVVVGGGGLAVFLPAGRAEPAAQHGPRETLGEADARFRAIESRVASLEQGIARLDGKLDVLIARPGK